MIEIIRTRFARDIVAEVALPARPRGEVVILLHGAPAVPAKSELLHWLAKKGYTVVFPRYRGTWESGGVFLHQSPEQDVLDVIGDLPRGWTDIATGRRMKTSVKRLILLGSSFGGPAAILAARHRRVNAAIALSPVIDWTQEGEDEPNDWFEQYLRLGFGGAYRYTQRDWKKLMGNRFYSPIHETETIPGQKLLLFHAKDDRIVPWKPTAELAEATGSHAYIFPRGGHYGLSAVMRPELWKPISTFLKS